MTQVPIKFDTEFTAEIDDNTRQTFPRGWSGKVDADIAVQAVRADAASNKEAKAAEKKAPKPKPAKKRKLEDDGAEQTKRLNEVLAENKKLSTQNAELAEKIDNLEREREAAEAHETKQAEDLAAANEKIAELSQTLEEAAAEIQKLSTPAG